MAKLQFLGWGGWRWADNVPCMHVHTWEMLRNCCVVLAIRVPCYEIGGVEMMTFLACAYICDAMLLHTSLCYTADGHVPGWERVFPCMCIHVRCCGNCALLLHTGPILRIHELVLQHFTFAPLLSLRPRACIASDVNMFPDVF